MPTAPFQRSAAAIDGDRLTRRQPGPSVKAAAGVLGLAAVVFTGGSIALGLGASTAPKQAPTTVPTAPGAPLRAAPASAALKPIELPGQPPANILQALAVPAGAQVEPGSAKDLTVANYDHLLGFVVPASQADVVAFFKAELRADGWQQVSSGPARGGIGIQVLAQHAGSDGNTWDAGVVVHATTFASSGSAAVTGTTAFTVELYTQSSQ